MHFSIFRSCKAFKRHFKKRGKGTVVTTLVVFLIFLASFASLLILPKISRNHKVKIDENPSITFVCVPYPVTNDKKQKTKDLKHANIIELYLMTMSSWLSTSNQSKLFILIPKSEFDHDNIIVPILESRFGENRIFFTPENERIECDENGVPFIGDWFIKGFDYVYKNNLSSLICFINSDIITPPGWFERCKFIYNHFKDKEKQMCIVSRRCDFDYYYNRNDNNNYTWPIDYNAISKDRTTHSPWGVDFFLISMNPMMLNIDEIPPFHMGKYRWDPWVTGWLNSNIELTSLGDSFCTYHVNHPPKPRNMEDVKVKENFELAARNGKYNCGNAQAKYKLKGRDLYQGETFITSIKGEIPPDNFPQESK